jgi:hypothetical protein
MKARNTTGRNVRGMVFRCLFGSLSAVVVVMGCDQEFDLATLPQPELIIADTSYVQVFPPFGGYDGAEDLQIGNDELMYVAHTRANRLVMLNRAGQILSERRILHPRSVAQDTRLDLLVGGEIVTSNGDTAGAIFRITLVSADPLLAHRLDAAPIDTVWRELARPSRRFPGLTVFGDNEYLAVRNGPDNSSLIDPDGRVLLFASDDRFITPVPAFTTRPGTGITDIYYPTGIASFPGVKDFVLIQSTAAVAYGAIWMRYEKSAEVDGWLPKFDPARPEDKDVDFIRPGQFLWPGAVTIDRSRRDVFVADAGLDSVFKFNSRGAFKSESFGFVRTGGAMLRPTGLAYADKVLYVLDGAQGQILRFRLSTDVPR